MQDDQETEEQSAEGVEALGWEQCPDGRVCFWTGKDYKGGLWKYDPGSGYQNTPAYIHKNANSFVSKASVDVNGIDWITPGQSANYRRIRPGDYRRSWDFGGDLDACDRA